ncbi:MAG TPA: Hsp70 family protein [Polyangia bacterium]|jgi:molecular chaperone DnaK
MSTPIVLGIDLGTSNSVAAVMQGEQIVLIPDAEGNRIHPSVVSFHASGTVLCGHKGKQRRITDPENTVFSAKRLIGRRFGSPEVRAMVARAPFTIKEGPREQPMIVTRAGEFTVPEIGAYTLGYLKQLAEAYLGVPVERAVITVPANFNDAQREATKAAGRLGGLEVLRILNEPTAAALAYGYGKSLQSRVAIFDFGGGTFDITILRLQARIFEVLATAGDTYLGGDDVDLRLCDSMVQAFLQVHGVDLRHTPIAVQRLRAVAEQVKCQLSERPRAVVRVQDVARTTDGQVLDFTFSLTRDGMNAKIVDIVDRAFVVCDEALRLAGMDQGAIDDVVLVGGTTKAQLVQERVKQYFGREPRADINPDEVVGIGAAIQGATLMQDLRGEQPKALLLDVTPRALGVATVGGYADTIIQRNAQVPMEQTRIFTTSADNQTQVLLQVCQGESRRFDENTLLGELTLDGLRPARRGEVRIGVIFEIDTDGILKVRARDEETGAAQQATISVLGTMTEDEIQAAKQRPGAAAESGRSGS